MVEEALSHIRATVIQEKVIKHPDRPEASRCFNYPFAALEEVICNAVYHRSYEIREPIEVRILPDKVTVTSFPGPDRSIRKEDIDQYRFLARRYRNRRIGEFLKELELTEGRGTGIPKILRKVKANGSPMPCFITDDDRSYFIVEFPIHPVFLPEKIDKEKSSGKSSNEILVLLLKTSSLTIPKLSEKLNISTRAVEKHIQALKKAGKLKRMGTRKEGWWEVVE